MLLRRFGPGDAARVVGAVGTVGAAYVAHVGAGAAAPAAPLPVALVFALGALAVLAPPRLRGPRVQIAAAALLQPVLHGLFDIAPNHSVASLRPTGSGTLMLLAHMVAAVVAAWWLTHGADRAVALASSASLVAVQLTARWRRAALLVLAATLDAASRLPHPAGVAPVGPSDGLPRAVRRRGPPSLVGA